eukprot:Tamp_21140.p2 GENE.Tamp_21140~~Tamp_21140.p2  ORF type:complete len:158 (+),score=40.60 Tamp_21140:363-836(+)
MQGVAVQGARAHSCRNAAEKARTCDACALTWAVPQIAKMIGWWPTKFIAMLVGVLYPSIESYKALKTENKDDDSQWLSYWIIFSLFTLVEFFLDIVLAWIPLYYEAKLIGLLYLALPQTRGALKLFQDHQDKLDLLYKQAIEQLNKIQAPAKTDKAE